MQWKMIALNVLLVVLFCFSVERIDAKRVACLCPYRTLEERVSTSDFVAMVVVKYSFEYDGKINYAVEVKISYKMPVGKKLNTFRTEDIVAYLSDSCIGKLKYYGEYLISATYKQNDLYLHPCESILIPWKVVKMKDLISIVVTSCAEKMMKGIAGQECQELPWLLQLWQRNVERKENKRLQLRHSRYSHQQ